MRNFASSHEEINKSVLIDVRFIFYFYNIKCDRLSHMESHTVVTFIPILAYHILGCQYMYYVLH